MDFPDLDLPWLDAAACADLDEARFFVDAAQVIDAETLAICTGCPVRADCLRHAYDSGYEHGYFGGLSAGQRRRWTLGEALVKITG